MKRDAFEISSAKRDNHSISDDDHDFLCAAEIIKGMILYVVG